MLSDADRALVIQELQRSLAEFLAATAELTPNQWEFRPGVGQWSIAECAAHLALTERAIVVRIQDVLWGSPEPYATDPVKGDRRNLRLIVDRSRKVTGPPSVTPGESYNSERGGEEFQSLRVATIDFAQVTAADLRAHGYSHFVLGRLDTVQWLLFLAAHTDRHLLQIEEIRSSQGSPSAIAVAEAGS